MQNDVTVLQDKDDVINISPVWGEEDWPRGLQERRGLSSPIELETLEGGFHCACRMKTMTSFGGDDVIG